MNSTAVAAHQTTLAKIVAQRNAGTRPSVTSVVAVAAAAEFPRGVMSELNDVLQWGARMRAAEAAEKAAAEAAEKARQKALADSLTVDQHAAIAARIAARRARY